MMTRTDLLEIIANDESSDVEFKRDDLQPQELAKELVAFANLDGGSVLLGVERDGTVSGIVRTNLEEWVMSVCRDKIRPPIIPFFEIVKGVADDKDVAIVRVTQGYDVHALWHNNMNRYLVRVGSQSREAGQEELARLFQKRGSLRAELKPVSGSNIGNLDLRRLRNYFEVIREQVVPANSNGREWRSLLDNTEIMTDEAATVVGMLLFGITPNRFLPHAGIDAVAYPGTEQDYTAIQRSNLRGPITPLLSDEGMIIESGLVEQALDFIRRNTSRESILDKGRLKEQTTYPDEALREGIVNALIHRDYLLTSTNIQLAIYSDRLEIVSPGRLPNGITPSRMRAGTRAARNQVLKDVMRDYRYLEHMGMGVPRKIVKGMQQHNGTDPELVEQNESFVLRLFAFTST